MSDLGQIKQVAMKAAKEAGDMLLQHFKQVKPDEVHQKTIDGRQSPVTDWDLKARTYLLQMVLFMNRLLML